MNTIAVWTLGSFVAASLLVGCTTSQNPQPIAAESGSAPERQPPLPSPAPTPPAQALPSQAPGQIADRAIPASPVIDAPFIGRWQTIAVLVFDAEAGRFRPVSVGPSAFFEFYSDGTWCIATAENIQGCLTSRPFTTDGTFIAPRALGEGEAPFRYRWRMVEQNLLLTLEQPQGNTWVPLLRWALEREGP